MSCPLYLRVLLVPMTQNAVHVRGSQPVQLHKYVLVLGVLVEVCIHSTALPLIRISESR